MSLGLPHAHQSEAAPARGSQDTSHLQRDSQRALLLSWHSVTSGLCRDSAGVAYSPNGQQPQCRPALYRSG